MTQGRLHVGVDEAGRGAVLGPLVVAACGLDKAAHHTLRQAGVGDSKGYGPPERARQTRADLAQLIDRHARWYRVRVVPPAEVDHHVRRRGLNSLERRVARALLSPLPPGTRIVLDGERLFGRLCREFSGAIALNKADVTELCVSAASVLAKATRDQLFAELAARYEPEFGPIAGGGYPNAATARFLEAFVERTGGLPPETRRTWRWAPVAKHVDSAGRDPNLQLSL